jgi:hypothetical protein
VAHLVPGRWRRVPLVAFVAFQMLIAAHGELRGSSTCSPWPSACSWPTRPPAAGDGVRPRPRTEATATPSSGPGRARCSHRCWPCRALVSLVQFSEATLGIGLPGPRPVVWLTRAVSPLRSVNSYGLFAVMTNRRGRRSWWEGSDDGETWRAYEFRYKPGDLRRRPGFVAPHQPRLDWQMWFAALGGSCDQSPWLEGLFPAAAGGVPARRGPPRAAIPSPTRPPRYVRALLYDYRFADLATHRQTGEWWQRRLESGFCGP